MKHTINKIALLLLVISFVNMHDTRAQNKNIRNNLWKMLGYEKAGRLIDVGYEFWSESNNEQFLDSVNLSHSYKSIEEISNSSIGYVEDAPNGFLHIIDDCSPCGCCGISTIAAYKYKSGDHIYIGKFYSFCEWTRFVRSSVDLKSILPEDLTWRSFYKKNETMDKSRRHLYAYLNIPRYGTDTELKVDPYFLGIDEEFSDDLCFMSQYGAGYSPDNEPVEMNAKREIRYIEEHLNSLQLDNELSQKTVISDENIRQIADLICHNNRNDEWFHSVVRDLEYAYLAYKEYLKLDVDTIILGWDSDKGKFYIKDKVVKPKVPFIEFLRTRKNYFVGLC